MAKFTIPTPEQIRQLVSYEPETGLLFWKPRDTSWFNGKLRPTNVWNTRYAGKQALSYISTYGYYCGAVLNYQLLAHRVVWAWHYGEWPILEIDHINRNRLDNRIENLRDVSHSENERNKSLSIRSKTGETGVYRTRSGRYSANYVSHLKKLQIGTYATIAEAAEARAKFIAAMKEGRE